MKLLEHLRSRRLNTEVHRVWIDESEGVATFPLWNLSGKMVGYQHYRPAADKVKRNNPKDSRYFTYRKNHAVGVWGLESWRFSNTLFLTEGVFDACRLTALGYSAVATLSNDVDASLCRWLWTIRKTRPVVAVCDADAAGRRLAKHGGVSHVIESGDLGDASDEYVKKLLKKFHQMG
jgi:DNA primase